MTSTKRKISVSLDRDIVAELEADEESLSTQINDVLRDDIARRRRQRMLAEMLDAMEAEDGPVDEALVQKFMDLLGVTPRLVLDAEAVSRLAHPGDRAVVRAALAAALRLRRDVIVPAVVLAELYRGPRHDQVVDSLLARETGIAVRDTDRPFARLVGGVLSATGGAASTDMVDAHVVATAVESGGGTVLTGDPIDLERLAAPYPHVHVGSV